MKLEGRLAGVELGGTKTIAVLAERGRIVAREAIPTTRPAETLGKARAFLEAWHREAPLDAIGIASFGPIRLDRSAQDFGHILPTPKVGWQGANIPGALIGNLPCPWRIDTDVNGAALAEYRWGAGTGLDSFWYMTLGTGVGGGLLIDGRPVHGALHPEVGHVRLRRVANDPFQGICAFHGDCLEGLVSGPALTARFGAAIEEVSEDDPRWEVVAQDLSELVANLLLTTGARAILFGGGVATKRALLIPRIRKYALARLAGYLPTVDARLIQQMVRSAALGGEAGVWGSIALADAAIAPGPL